MMTERKNITQPADWWAAFEAAAKADGKTLSEWLGNAGRLCLSRRADSALQDRQSPGRPVSGLHSSDETS